MPTADPIIREKIKPSTEVPEPHLYSVIYMNDEVTSMDFVIESLISVFNHNQEDAEALMQKVHTEGSAVVAVLPYELAEQKGVEVTMLARNNGYPLLIRLEPTV
jgi:ATP-dependent Clp protease adaptor protein ClpS